MRRTISSLMLLVAALPAGADSNSRQTLPTSVVPVHYDLSISPDAENLNFSGTVKIDLDVTKPTHEVVLNAKGLTFDLVRLDGVAAQSTSMDSKLNRATLVFVNAIDVGRHQLEIAYHGPILQTTTGIFAMDYESPAGKRRTLATNFEPADARGLLPCWDEPALKATFAVSVVTPKDRMALSNMPIQQVTPVSDIQQRVQFATTPKMSAYLLFITVGDYERVHRSVDGTDVGIVVKRGDLSKAAYALDQASTLLHYYNEYFGIGYPLSKLDLIAAPGQITGGSMENWGAIFYSQDELLFDPEKSTREDQQTVFEVVSHEMAHQWFGDLVTMAWWDNLWLNEGFARWMQTHAADALHPEWRTGLQAQSIFARGKDADAKPSTHPVLQNVDSAEQAAQAFDSITYDKGAAVITMLERYGGADRFREGVRRYMRAHAYANTVDHDLWSQVEAVADKPVVAIERDFTQQPGLPLIRVTPKDSVSELSTGRFYEDPTSAPPFNQSWKIPLGIAVPGQTEKTLLLSGTTEIKDADPLVNAGGWSYVRVLYPPSQVKSLAGRFAALPAPDQYNLLMDAFSLGWSGYASPGDLLEYIADLPPSADPIVLRLAVEDLAEIDKQHDPTPERARFRNFALKVLAPIADRVGTMASVEEDPALTALRSQNWVVQARFGDPAALARATAVYNSKTASSDERKAALTIVAQNADAATFDALIAQARAATDPLDRSRILEAVAQVDDPKLSARFVEIAIGPDAAAGTAPELLGIAGWFNPDAVWTALVPHFDDPKLPIDQQSMNNPVPWIAGGSAKPERMADLRGYADKHLPSDARQAVVEAIASIQANIRTRKQVLPQIDKWVAEHSSIRSDSAQN
jgi:aminopeptidase N